MDIKKELSSALSMLDMITIRGSEAELLSAAKNAIRRVIISEQEVQDASREK